MLEPGTSLQGRYRIERLVGYGGMATVYLASDCALGGRKVAVKELTFHIPDPEARRQAIAQFRKEAEIVARLEHPRLVPVYDYFQSGDSAYLVMAYVDGPTLQEVASQAPGFLATTTVLEWVDQVCDVLEYLHEQVPPVLFRDLKPTNCMHDARGGVRLIDFGIARTLDPGQTTSTFLKGMGTSGFSPVEQFGGKTDARSDIYALGATAYCLLTLALPPASVDRVCGQENLVPIHRINPEVPVAVDEVIQGMMALRKEDRPASVREAREALRRAACAHGVGSVDSRDPLPSRMPATGDPDVRVLGTLVGEVLAGERSQAELQEALRERGWAPEALEEPWRSLIRRALGESEGETPSSPTAPARPEAPSLASGAAARAATGGAVPAPRPALELKRTAPSASTSAPGKAAVVAAALAPVTGARPTVLPLPSAKAQKSTAGPPPRGEAVGSSSTHSGISWGSSSPPSAESISARIRAGGTVQVPAGTWTLSEPLSVSGSLQLVGEGAESCRLRHVGVGPLLRFEAEESLRLHGVGFLLEAAGPGGPVVEVAQGRFDISGCSFSGGRVEPNGQGGAGLRLSGRSEGRVVACEASGNRVGIEVAGSARARLEDNQCHGNEWIGICFDALSGGEASGNEVRGHRRCGIVVAGNASPSLVRNRCQDNETAGILYTGEGGGTATENVAGSNRLHGIFVNDQANPTLDSNRCASNRWSGIAVAGTSEAVLRANECRENGRYGILVCQQARPCVESSRCEANGEDGMAWFEGAGGQGRGNECNGNTRHGISVSEKAGPTLEGNTCRRNASCGLVYEGEASGAASANALEENVENGIEIHDEASPHLEGNRCLRNRKAGVMVLGSACPVLRENECSANLYGVYVDEGAVPLLETNHCLQNQASGMAWFGHSGGEASGNLLRGNVHGLYVDDHASVFLQENRCVQNRDSGLVWCGHGTGTARGNESSFNRFYGAYVADEASPSIENCRFFSNKIAGVHYQGQASGDLRLNQAFNNGQDGVEVTQRAAPSLRENRCHNNARHGVSWSASACGGAHDNELNQNECSGAWVGENAEPRLEANRCVENKACGIEITGSASPTVLGNQCLCNSHQGILVRGEARPTLEGNRCHRNRESGMEWRDRAAGAAQGNQARENELHGLLVSDDAWPDLGANDCRDNQAVDQMIPSSRHRGGQDRAGGGGASGPGARRS